MVCPKITNVKDSYRYLMKINKSVPVICAECTDAGKIIRLADGNHLTCGLMNAKPIYGSKPKWCPKPPLFEEQEQSDDWLSLFDEVNYERS